MGNPQFLWEICSSAWIAHRHLCCFPSTSGWLKCPLRLKACKLDASCICSKKALLAGSPWSGACRRPQQQGTFHWSCPWFLLSNCQSVCSWFVLLTFLLSQEFTNSDQHFHLQKMNEFNFPLNWESKSCKIFWKYLSRKRKHALSLIDFMTYIFTVHSLPCRALPSPDFQDHWHKKLIYVFFQHLHV